MNEHLPVISIVIPFYNEAGNVDVLYRHLATVLDLSRNFGKEAALTAGLGHACCSAVIPFDADLQDLPELIPELLARWREGYDRQCRAQLPSEGMPMGQISNKSGSSGKLPARSAKKFVEKPDNFMIPASFWGNHYIYSASS